MQNPLIRRIVSCLAAAAAVVACQSSEDPSGSVAGVEGTGSTTTEPTATGPGGEGTTSVPAVPPPAVEQTTPLQSTPPQSTPPTPVTLPGGAGGDDPSGPNPPIASGGPGGTAAGSGGTESGAAGQSGSPAGGSLGMPGGSGGTQSGGGAGAAGGGAAGSSGASAGGSSGAGSVGDVVPSMGCDAAEWPSSDRYTIDVAGSNREYILRIPDDYDPSRPYRLVLAFHWLNGTADNVANGGGTTTGPYYGFWDLAEGSTIFVAPQGINNSWPSGNVPFAEALIDRLTSEFCIDESRIFSTGFSMGGSMSYAVACGLGSRIRAVAVYSGGPMSGCDPHDEPVAYFMSHGTQDSVCTYPGFGVPQIEDFAEVNGCTPREMPQPSGNEPSCVDYDGCMEGYPARACIFVGDHTPSPGGGGSWVPEEAWNFLSQF